VACGQWFQIPLCPECYSYIEEVIKNRVLRDMATQNCHKWLLRRFVKWLKHNRLDDDNLLLSFIESVTAEEE